MTFKTEGEIYNDLKTKLQIYIPAITNYEPGGIARAILRVTAAAIRLLYVVLEFLYWNIFATYADREALRRHYEDWGLTWNSPTTSDARKTILNKYRQKGVGSLKWYEDTILLNFEEVDSAIAETGIRGINTIDITVSYHNSPLPDDVLQDIQDYFAQDDKNVCGIDVLVKTTEGASVI